MHFKVMSLTWLIQFGCTKERRKIVAGAKWQDIYIYIKKNLTSKLKEGIFKRSFCSVLEQK